MYGSPWKRWKKNVESRCPDKYPGSGRGMASRTILNYFVIPWEEGNSNLHMYSHIVIRRKEVD